MKYLTKFKWGHISEKLGKSGKMLLIWQVHVHLNSRKHLFGLPQNVSQIVYMSSTKLARFDVICLQLTRKRQGIKE